MSALTNIVCPISTDLVDSNTSRLTVFINAVLLLLFVVTNAPILIIIVAADYIIRAAWKPKYSPIRWVSAQIMSALKVSPKMVDAAPKLFASRIGVLFAVTILVLYPGYLAASVVVAEILLAFAVLDSVFNFCVGCLTYHYIVFPLLGKDLAKTSE